MEYAKMKFYCDEHRCIECDGCSIACAEAHELPVGISRRKVVTINEGIPGKEFSTSIACMHCTDAPCEQVCPVDCILIDEVNPETEEQLQAKYEKLQADKN